MTETFTKILPIIGLYVFLLAACGGGFWLGRRPRPSRLNGLPSGVGDVLGPVTALLALLLGFSVAMAEGHYATRKRLAIDEANAIGTALLRTQLVPPPERGAIAELLHRYVQVRSTFYDQWTASEGGTDNAEQTRKIQADLWAHVATLGERAPHLMTTGLLVGSLNQIFDLEESQRNAVANSIPGSIFALLAFGAVLVMGMVGFQMGLYGARHGTLTSLLALLLASTLFVILDLDKSREGFIKIRNESLKRLSLGQDSR